MQWTFRSRPQDAVSPAVNDPRSTIPLSGSQRVAAPIAQSGIADRVAAPAAAPAGNRRGIYIAISVVVVVAALIAAGFAVVRLVRTTPAKNATPETVPAVPDTNSGIGALNTPPCQPNDSRCWSHLPMARRENPPRSPPSKREASPRRLRKI